ncbi:hypothetical protein Acor_44170 [Acrocarpospora corrugata]|uniref:Lipoprotein n=1 Tax=Acrocarpospora corrugata TaxID=35763 RepID=A0A5M3W5A5_9ACTN|nr:hypothetical protein [Acrocarpospora corrugata]GES02351.1 hypothetical protein Acor_44170 [Acrocarpospora corrugata]
MAEKGLRIAALVAIPLFLAACGSQAPETGIASAAGATTSATAAPSPTSSGDALKFAQCMRENGVDMPDPEPGGNQVMIRQKKGQEAVTEKALKACEQYQPVIDAKKVDDGKLQDSMMKFAQCMRDNGVDMPDPQVEGGRVKMGGPGMDPESPTTKKAMEICRPLMGNGPGGSGGVGGPGGGGGGGQ